MIHRVDDGEVKVEHHICDFHKKNPGAPYAGCTCVSSYALMAKTGPIHNYELDFWQTIIKVVFDAEPSLAEKLRERLARHGIYPT